MTIVDTGGIHCGFGGAGLDSRNAPFESMPRDGATAAAMWLSENPIAASLEFEL